MQHLDSLIGNLPARQYLRHMIEKERVHHTLLFHGAEGVGKRSSAFAFAKELGIKPSDIREFVPEGKAFLHTIDAMGEVKKAAVEHPYESQRKMLLIRDADRMLPSGANALLKTLEEPLETTLIVLTTTRLDAILETIQSRACLVAFRTLSSNEVRQFLEERKMDEEQRDKAVLFAQGSLSRAIAYENEQKAEEMVSELLESVVKGDYIGSMDLLSNVEEIESEHLLTLIFQWFRDAHLLRNGGDPSLLFYKTKQDLFASFSRNLLPDLDVVYALMKKAHTSIKHNMKMRSILEGMICTLIPDNRFVTSN